MDKSDLTSLLLKYRAGKEGPPEELIQAVYQELRQLAQYYLQQERSDHTLQATALVHEAYLRLFGGDASFEWQDKAHFFALAARQMRRILVDHARRGHAEKRFGGQLKLSLDEISGNPTPYNEDVLALEEAMEGLEAIAPRASQVVELRYFGGLMEKEAAEVLGISLATLKRDWDFAKAWLYNQLKSN